MAYGHPGKNVLLEIFFLGRMYDLQRLVLDHSRIISRLPVWFVRVHFHVGPVSFVDMLEAKKTDGSPNGLHSLAYIRLTPAAAPYGDI